MDHPPWFKISLLAGIQLEIKMTKIYPDGVPEIRVISVNEDYVSKIQLNDLVLKLRNQAELLIGNEMCFDLIEMAREFGEQFFKTGKTSFHTEMILRQQERDRLALDQQSILMQKNEELLMKQRRAEMEELEKKIHEELKAKLKINEKGKFFNSNSSEYFKFDPPIFADGVQICKVEFPVDQKIKSKWPFGQICKVQSSKEHNFDLLIVPLTHPFLQTFGGRRQLDVLLKNLKGHPLKENENVLRYFGGSIDKENLQMFLLREHSAETSVTLEIVIEQAGALGISRITEYLKQICSGLIHLHSSGLAHRSLDLNCILLDDKRNIKVVDYLVQKSLSNLGKEHGIVFENYNPIIYESAWEAPEIVARPNLHGKKVDIWSLGRIALQMLLGRDALKSFPGGFDDLMMSSQGQSIPPNLKQFLRGCFNLDAAKRLSAEELLNCKIFTDTVDLVNMAHHKITQFDFKPELRNIEVSKLNQAQARPNSNSTSRYLTDFEELEFLGRGGFGSVVKVRNKIDDRFYAVKKIALDPRDIEYNKKILREVTTLSRLHHERIIRYYQAWIEDDEYTHTDDEESDDLSASNDKLKLETRLSFKRFSGLEDFSDEDFDEMKNDDSADFIEFEMGNGEEDELIDETSQSYEKSDSYENSGSEFRESEASSLLSNTIEKSYVKSKPRGQVLYIQMEYCPNQTLRDLIDERSADPLSHFLDSTEIWRLFRQIVEGLVHIHAQGMMHRDLKPSNIFLDSNGDVKIGDFGLAVTRLESASNIRSDSPLNLRAPLHGDKSFTGESHTQNIGTPFYVSPEQLGAIENVTSSVARYNQKVDMYALGIICIELWVPFKTGMERIQSLQKCRLSESILPPELDENVVKIVKRLLCHDAKKRFTSLELLRSEMLPPMLEDELIEDAMRSVAQPGAPHFSRLISTIFRRLGDLDVSQLRPKDFAFDVHSGNATELQYYDDLGRLKREIKRIFVKFGAIEVNPPLLYLPLNGSGMEAMTTYSVLDDAGQRLELPSNLTRPFARWVAQSSVQLKPGGGTFKRFTFDRVFQKISQVSGGQPYQPCEASFDLIHVEEEEGFLEFCQVVRVIFDALLAVGAGKPEHFVIKLNHLKLFERLRSVQMIPEIDWNFGGPAISRISSGGGVFDEKLFKLLTPTKLEEPAEMILQRLAGYFPDLKLTLLKTISDSLQGLQKISIPLKVKMIFDPLFCGPRADLYINNWTFVVMREVQGEKPRRYGGGVNYETVACGGGYNQLLEEYKFPTARLEGRGPFALGATLFLDRLKSSSQTGQLKPQRKLSTCGPLILNLLSDVANCDEMWLIGELWRTGRTNLTVNRKNLNQNKSSSSLILQMKATGRIVRIKRKNSVEEVSLDQISTKLDEEFCEYDYTATSDIESALNPEMESELYEGVHYLMQQTKSERNQPLLREKALRSLKLSNLTKCEIIIHDIPHDILKKFFYDPGNILRVKSNEEYRQLNKLAQLMQSKLVGKTLFLFNHKDQQIDLHYNSIK